MDSFARSKYLAFIKELPDSELEAEIANPQRLLLNSGFWGSRQIDVAYAPFDHVNQEARIVIVGLTPGRQQMRNAILEARKLLRRGKTEREALEEAKVFASFSGPMRSNLIALLDFVGIQRVLGVDSTASLWGRDARLVHFTSALRYPVFLDGNNYSGAPAILTTPVLRDKLRWIAEEMKVLSDAIFVPLGPKVANALLSVAKETGVDRARILDGLPHPSGANAERIAFFLGRKPDHKLSVNVDAGSIIHARGRLLQQVNAMA